MKKALLGIAGLLIMAFVVILFVNAVKDPVAKTKTETSAKAPACTMKCNQATTTSEGCGMAQASVKKCCETAQTSKCDPATCKNKECDKAKCEGMGKEATAGTKSSDMSKCMMAQKK